VKLKRFTIYMHALLIGTLLLSSCSSKPQDGPGNSTANEQIVSSTPPFQTKEPQHYQAIRTITFSDPSGTVVTRKTTIARSEILRREETEAGEVGNIVFLELDKARFVLLPGARIYSEMTDTAPIDREFENSPERLLHPGAVTTSYQKLGTELASGRKTTKYRVVVNTSTGENVTASETLVWVDESLGMPVRSETTSTDGKHVVMELSNIVLETDKNLFLIPEGYAKVPASEMRRRLGQKQVR
jgi:hypothetical protein